MSGQQEFSLDHDSALVLFEFLARWSQDDGDLSIEHPSEEYVLLQILAALERTLVEPFDPKYRQILEQARERIRTRI